MLKARESKAPSEQGAKGRFMRIVVAHHGRAAQLCTWKASNPIGSLKQNWGLIPTRCDKDSK